MGAGVGWVVDKDVDDGVDIVYGIKFGLDGGFKMGSFE